MLKKLLVSSLFAGVVLVGSNNLAYAQDVWAFYSPADEDQPAITYYVMDDTIKVTSYRDGYGIDVSVKGVYKRGNYYIQKMHFNNVHGDWEFKGATRNALVTEFGYEYARHILEKVREIKGI